MSLPGAARRVRLRRRMAGGCAAFATVGMMMVPVTDAAAAAASRDAVSWDATASAYMPLMMADASLVNASSVDGVHAGASHIRASIVSALLTNDEASGMQPEDAVYAFLGIDGSADTQYRTMDADAGSGNSDAAVSGGGAHAGAAGDGSAGTKAANDAVTEKADLPWNVTVLFSKDGPEADASTLPGASGTIGMEIRLRARTDQARGLTPIVTFSVPAAVTSDVTSNVDGTTVTNTGKELLVRATAKHAGGDADFRFTMDAKDFSMGQVAIIGVPSSANATGSTAGASDATSASGAATATEQDAMNQRALALAAGARAFADAQTGAGSESDQRLIASLQTMRDGYLAQAKAQDAATDEAYYRELANYMATFSQAYAGHLSGAPGDSTQMGAVAQLYSDLNGDTPMSRVVTALANAVDTRSDARRADGAADMLNDMMTRVKRQGAAGLADELRKQIGVENTGGDADYKKGQDQLRAAMIPYSMAYLDAYSKNLNAQMQAGQSITGGHQAAVDATTAGFEKSSDAEGYHRQIAAALDTLAAARERNGRADACRRVLAELADQLEADDASGAGGGASGKGSADGVAAGPVVTLNQTVSQEGNAARSQGDAARAGTPGLSSAAVGSTVGARGVSADVASGTAAESEATGQAANQVQTVVPTGIVPSLRATWGGEASVPTLRKDASWLIDDAVGISQGADVAAASLAGGASQDAGASGSTGASPHGWLLTMPAITAQTAADGDLGTSLWTKVRRFLSLS